MSKEQALFDRHYDEVISKTWNYAGRCKTINDHVSNAVLGLAGESGEVADQVKKWLYHSEKPFDFHREKMVSELGDVFFYLIKFMHTVGITVDECLEDNAKKLASRHPELGQVTERFGEGYIK